MKFRIFDDMTQCSEQEIARLLPLVSPHRREQALRYSHVFGRYCCLKSYELLVELLYERSGERYLPNFLYNEHGTPYLDHGPYFSISHCREGIAVAVGDSPIGIDIEGIRDVDVSLIRKTMNDQESRLILSSRDPKKEFIRYWTRKEAFVKMQGTGIISDMHSILSDLSSVQWQEIVDKDSRFICTICQKDIICKKDIY